MTHLVDEISLQRLVDGVLDAERQRQLLLDLESSPELWRTVALAFVEEQILQAELSADRSTQGDPRKDRVQRRPSSWSTLSPMTALALVASLLVVFGLGVGWGTWQAQPLSPANPPPIAAIDDNDDDMAQPNSSVVSIDAEEGVMPEDGTSDPTPVYWLMLGQEDGAQVELPVYTASQMGDMPWELENPERYRQFAETLIQRGYHADMQTEYLSGRLEDGQQIVVPCRTVSLKYAAQ